MSVKEKFLDYVSYDTQSDSSSTTMPSTMKQKLLAQHLADEMVAMGIEDAHMDGVGLCLRHHSANCEKEERRRLHRAHGYRRRSLRRKRQSPRY